MEGDQASRFPEDETRSALLYGELSRLEPVPWGSNATFLVAVSHDSRTLDAIYKPRSGERPLSDFPSGTLYKREYAAYLVARALKWDFIPTTVVRDGPYGVGSVQQFIDSDLQSNYFTLREEVPWALERIALFDCLSNNADRKAGHCFKGLDGRVWSIDHGLTFHQQPKLRTVIWDFAEQPIPRDLLEQVEGLMGELGSGGEFQRALGSLLAMEEVEALRQRSAKLLREARFPDLDPFRRNVPWPWF